MKEGGVFIIITIFLFNPTLSLSTCHYTCATCINEDYYQCLTCNENRGSDTF